jgi:hypothetical protein
VMAGELICKAATESRACGTWNWRDACDDGSTKPVARRGSLPK